MLFLLSKRDKYQKTEAVCPDSRYKRQKGEDVRGREGIARREKGRRMGKGRRGKELHYQGRCDGELVVRR